MRTIFLLISLLFLSLTIGCEDTSHLGDYGGDLEIVNSTGHTFWELYVGHHKSKYWEENLLKDGEVIANGETFTVYLKGYASPIFDILAIDQNNDSYTYTGVDISEYNVEFTIDDLDE